jgi:mannose-1-phosphate guanylyltransferase/mannose-6-phosphate isomerase
MIIVIIAGGSGTRLWPLSTPDYPKHLLTINGDSKSLLQHTYDRAKRLTKKIYVVSEISHINHVKKQLPELSKEAFIVEPGRRGTANCIIAALAYISKLEDPNEQIVSIHSDHYIRDVVGFYNTLRIATKVSKIAKKIVLIGVEPTYPATGFGYIEKNTLIDESDYAYNVKLFKEKPDYNTAKAYVSSGNYLWNCGYFVGSVNVFKNNMKRFAPDLLDNYKKLLTSSSRRYKDTYLSFDSEAIDYALIEKVKDLLVIPASFDWMDLGSYDDLHKAAGGNIDGNHISGNIEIESVNNSYIHNEENKPLAVIGLDNIAVINTPNGILVLRKDLGQKVGDVSKRLGGKN